MASLSSRDPQRLLDQLCVRFGFCLAPADQLRLTRSPPRDAKGFVDAVYRAEGLVPDALGLGLYRDILSVVAPVYAEAEHRRLLEDLGLDRDD